MKDAKSVVAVVLVSAIAACTTTDEGTLQLQSAENPAELHPSLTEAIGDNTENSYDVQAGRLTLCAGPNTEQWGDEDTAPSISYNTEGDFEARVNLSFSPTEGYEFAGLGVRSTEMQDTWLRVGKAYADFSGFGRNAYIVIDVSYLGRSNKIAMVRCDADTVYLKIAKNGKLFNFFYSTNGRKWVALRSDYVFDVQTDVAVYLTALSWGDGTTCARFSQVAVERS